MLHIYIYICIDNSIYIYIYILFNFIPDIVCHGWPPTDTENVGLKIILSYIPIRDDRFGTSWTRRTIVYLSAATVSGA